MNETIKTIMSRRSCRAFTAEAPSREDIELIVNCGLWAPSGMNRQGWHFTVIQDAGLISRLSEAGKEMLPQPARDRYIARHAGDENFSLFYKAPVLIMISTDENSRIDGALATENICLAAESLGLGSCIIGLVNLAFQSQRANELLGELHLPEGYKPLHAIAVGYKNMESPPPERTPGKADYIG